MKLKSLPEDFVVREMSAREPTKGAYSLYELSKTSLGTLEALRTIRVHWNLAPGQISHAGLKDRHAKTTQRITIKHGPKADHQTEQLRLRYLGPTPTAMAAADIVGNEFEIIVRCLTEEHSQELQSRVPLAKQYGVPNYFDSQRFGSLGPSEKFVANAWCRKDFERAAWLALAEYNSHDRSEEKRDKTFLREHWGEWKLCKDNLSKSNRRSVVTYLVDHPENYRKAFALIDPDMRGLYLSAFQSAVWNRMLARQFDSTVRVFECRIADSLLPFAWPDETLQSATLPLPSARLKSPSAEVQELCNDALLPYGLSLAEMKLSFPRDKWFSRGERAAVLHPSNLTAVAGDDEQNPGKSKLKLMFQLPRGSYATMLIRQLTEPANISAETSNAPQNAGGTT